MHSELLNSSSYFKLNFNATNFRIYFFSSSTNSSVCCASTTILVFLFCCATGYYGRLSGKGCWIIMLGLKTALSVMSSPAQKQLLLESYSVPSPFAIDEIIRYHTHHVPFTICYSVCGLVGGIACEHI